MGNVAIADDDVTYIRCIKRAVARLPSPVELVTFARGDDAARALCASAVDIAIIDLRLPGLDGLEVCRRIKAAQPATFVVIASAHLSADARAAAAEAGADRTISKPYDVPALIAQRTAAAIDCSSAVELLSSEHLEMAKNIAGSLARRYGSFLPPDEIDSLALLGLCEAAARYDATKNGLFIAFAASRIRGAVLDEVRKLSAKSRTDHARDRAASEARQLLADENKDTGDADVAALLGCSVDQLRKVRASWVRLPTQEMRRLPSELPELAEVLELAQQRRKVAVARCELDGVEADVIHMHYDQGMSLGQIAQQLGLPERKVMQAHARGVSRLRELVGRSA